MDVYTPNTIIFFIDNRISWGILAPHRRAIFKSAAVKYSRSLYLFLSSSTLSNKNNYEKHYLSKSEREKYNNIIDLFFWL